ncbi:hypothetical protein BC937DRAFT_95041 [Endogone sp. FLAS-F59071]|nr:hypothetical protein BC937DRAFT_95041 [Endogone sp. FLAS-F59071]|eukprot:RUS20503.1 hypothetical protein BC937DRAFT_95041 [Endogone sp. FLAS-F59071]
MQASSTYYGRTANTRARDSKHCNHHRKPVVVPSGAADNLEAVHQRGSSFPQTASSYHGSTISRKSRKIHFTETAATAFIGPAQHIRFNQETSDGEDMNSVSTHNDKDNSSAKNLDGKQPPKKIFRTESDTFLSKATVSAETLNDNDDKPQEINYTTPTILTTKQDKQNYQNEYFKTKDTTASSSTLGCKRKASESFEKQSDSSVSAADHSANEGPSSPVQKDTDNSVILSQATLEKIERRKQKKQRKKEEKIGPDGVAIPTYPSFKFNLDGFKGRRIGMKDVRELVLWCLADGVNPSWMLVQNRQHLRKFVVVFVQGLDPSLFNLSYDIHRNQSQPINMMNLKTSKPPALENMPFFTKLFGEVVLTKGPGEKTRIFSPVMGIMQCPLSVAEKQRRTSERRDNAKKHPVHEPAYYVLSLKEMIEADYPIPSSLSSAQLEEGWIETRPALNQVDNAKARRKRLVAMDCEMCKSLSGTELTRVTLVDENSTVIFDELVMPTEPIVDYLTQYSGITEERLRGTTTSLRDVQRRLLDLIDHDTILVGHSLEHDLKALKMTHPHIIDTAYVFHHTRGPPYKPGLKWLANRWLNREIQAGTSGHDSAEDALACMDLIKLKLKHGPDFGHYQMDTESLFVRLERHVPPRHGAVVDSGNGAGMYAQKARSVENCENDRHAISKVLEVVQNHDFVWVRLRELERFYGNMEAVAASLPGEPDSSRIPKATLSSPPLEAVSPQAMTTVEIASMLTNLDAQIQRLYEGLPKGTALVTLSGVGDVKETQRLITKQNKYKDLWQRLPQSQILKEDLWTEQDTKDLETAVDRAKMGVGFFCVK